jgi:hypothetical protein
MMMLMMMTKACPQSHLWPRPGAFHTYTSIRRIPSLLLLCSLRLLPCIAANASAALATALLLAPLAAAAAALLLLAAVELLLGLTGMMLSTAAAAGLGARACMSRSSVAGGEALQAAFSSVITC